MCCQIAFPTDSSLLHTARHTTILTKDAANRSPGAAKPISAKFQAADFTTQDDSGINGPHTRKDDDTTRPRRVRAYTIWMSAADNDELALA